MIINYFYESREQRRYQGEVNIPTILAHHSCSH